MVIGAKYVLINIFILCAVVGCLTYLFILLTKALKTYINSKQIRQEKLQSAKSLGEVLKTHRTDCKMTQEFIAEHLGISRQAVSKWESGASAPSTSNLIALAKLFEVNPEPTQKNDVNAHFDVPVLPDEVEAIVLCGTEIPLK